MSKNDFADFEQDLLALAMDVKKKESRNFIKREGSELRKETKNVYKSKGIGTGQGESKDVENGFKRGKPYMYQSKDLSIRVYNSHPLAHLLNKGHRIVDKNKNEIGFVVGYNFMEDAEKRFQNKYFNDTQDWLDELINEHGL
ncbi:hypothetical protein [Tepidibacter mesophilus]|uniref:hypothetical protein n=1 Tax=Tepidibacter mesophilus TaxID=655607 RepID=UPI000C085333|nr:hypothetical protein [Tepidibacter mesophilus]